MTIPLLRSIFRHPQQFLSARDGVVQREFAEAPKMDPLCAGIPAPHSGYNERGEMMAGQSNYPIVRLEQHTTLVEFVSPFLERML